MNIIISNSAGKPIYKQIESQIKKMILTGALTPGTALPSMRFLAKELRISVITTKRSYEDLEREGFLESVTGKGTFVAYNNYKSLIDERRETIVHYFKEAIISANDIGITNDELISMLKLCLKEREDTI